MKCFNIGANLGVYALQFAHWTGPQGRVWAFEPNPNTARELENHIHMNGYSAICEIVPMAVSMEPGTAEFHISGTDGMSRLGVPNPELSGKTIPITVEVTTIDTFCAMNNVRPDVMMIDVEGFEIAALEGAVKLLSDTHPLPIIVIEMHPSAWLAANTTKEQFSRFLKKHDLQLVPLSGQTDPLVDYGHVALERLDNH
jgi:FkbM family methyltransferase